MPKCICILYMTEQWAHIHVHIGNMPSKWTVFHSTWICRLTMFELEQWPYRRRMDNFLYMCELKITAIHRTWAWALDLYFKRIPCTVICKHMRFSLNSLLSDRMVFGLTMGISIDRNTRSSNANSFLLFAWSSLNGIKWERNLTLLFRIIVDIIFLTFCHSSSSSGGKNSR